MQAFTQTQITGSPAQLPQIAQQILNFANDICVFYFEGQPGAGKTSIIKEICAQKGYTGLVQSPTFNLINTYDAPSGLIYHFDFYRLNQLTEIADLGVADYLYSGHMCLFEWGQLLMPHTDLPYIRIKISHQGHARTYTLETHPR